MSKVDERWPKKKKEIEEVCPQLLSHHKHYKSMSQRPIGKELLKM
jgi:hypothetical protein